MGPQGGSLNHNSQLIKKNGGGELEPKASERVSERGHLGLLQRVSRRASREGRSRGRTQDVYPELAQLKDWRKVLSNFHVDPFEYEGHTYRSIEHAFHAAKLKEVYPDALVRFTTQGTSRLRSRPRNGGASTSWTRSSWHNGRAIAPRC
jgi:hypothetical protein